MKNLSIPNKIKEVIVGEIFVLKKKRKEIKCGEGENSLLKDSGG